MVLKFEQKAAACNNLCIIRLLIPTPLATPHLHELSCFPNYEGAFARAAFREGLENGHISAHYCLVVQRHDNMDMNTDWNAIWTELETTDTGSLGGAHPVLDTVFPIEPRVNKKPEPCKAFGVQVERLVNKLPGLVLLDI